MALDRVVYRFILRRQFRRERIFRDRSNPFDVYDDIDLYDRFRFRRANIIDLVDLVENTIDHPFQRKGSIPPLLQVMVALRFYATGTMQIVVADTFGIDKTTVSRIITRVSAAFARRLKEYVCLPAAEETAGITAKFYAMAGFPNVIGCIDCTHIPILRPSEREQQFVNRKGRHTINVQLMCDADLIIRQCVVNWPGSVHDARILRESSFFKAMERNPRPLPGIILGDSGYPLRDWLITPFLNPDTRAKERFNRSHCSTRSTIERANGVLKRRFHCLQAQLRYTPVKAKNIIASCIVLHNIARRLGLPDLNDNSYQASDEDSDNDNEGDQFQDAAMPGRLARDRIVARFFLR